MEEKKMTNEELQQVVGGKGGGTGAEIKGIVNRTTAYYSDKNLKSKSGTIQHGTHVTLDGYYEGDKGNVFKITTVNTKKTGYVPRNAIDYE